METCISGSTTPLHTKSTTIWSYQDNFKGTEVEGTEQPKKIKQSNRSLTQLTHASSKISSTNTKTVDLDTCFIGQGVLKKLMKNSELHSYLKYLNTRKISNDIDLQITLLSLERSKIFAETVLKFGHLELFEESKALKMTEDDFTPTQLASIYGENLTKILALSLSKAVYISEGIEIDGLPEKDAQYLAETFKPFSSNQSLKELLYSKDEADIRNILHFMSTVIVSLWTKSGHHESYNYLAAFHQALYNGGKNEVSIRYESDRISSVRQGKGIAVPGISGTALYISDINKKYNKLHKNGNKLDFTVTKEMANLCHKMIEDMHNIFDEILLSKSAETQNDSEEKISLKNEISLHFKKFKEAKEVLQGVLQKEIILEKNKKALLKKTEKALQKMGFGEVTKALREIEEERIQETENAKDFSIFNDNAGEKYKEWLETQEKKSKFIAETTQLIPQATQFA